MVFTYSFTAAYSSQRILDKTTQPKKDPTPDNLGLGCKEKSTMEGIVWSLTAEVFPQVAAAVSWSRQHPTALAQGATAASWNDNTQRATEPLNLENDNTL